MRRRGLIAAALLAAASRAPGEPVPSPADMVVRAATDYRAGRTTAALEGAARVLEREPENAAAKNLIWTIAREAKRKRVRVELAPGERDRAAKLARQYLADRRRKTEDVLEELRKVEAQSEELRSPSGILSALDGLDRSLGDRGVEQYGERAQVRFSNILRNLDEALDKQAFSTRKDHMRAQGYLAYYKKDWARAVKLWEEALKEDPSDAQLRNDLSSLQILIRRRKEREEIQDYLAQAETYFETGLYSHSVEAWEEVLKRDPHYPGAVEGLAASRIAQDKAEQLKKLKGMMEDASVENRAGRPMRAAEICLEALQVDPTYAPARALLRLVGKRFSASETAPRHVPGVQSEPPATGDRLKAEPLYKQGLLLYSDGDLPGAVKCWRESLALDPSFSKAREALRQGESELAILQK